MNLSCYLIVQGKKPRHGLNRDGRRDPGTVRVVKSKPACARDEVAIKLSLDIPDTLFVRPSLEAHISVPMPGDPVITADVQERISEIIQQQTGLTVRIEASEGSHDDDREPDVDAPGDDGAGAEGH